MEIRASNVNDMLSEALWRFKVGAVVHETRNGRALVIEEPTILTYYNPMERVLFWPERDANPIFHLMEAIWIVAGRDDVAFVEQFNSSIGQFSDDGEVFNAPYGQRIRSHFGTDQLVDVIEHLRSNRSSRQAVIQIWDPADLNKVTKDKACNMSVIFDINNDRLNMSVMNRSNDLWWGACGANAVHFSFLQELIAFALGVEMGYYRQISNNLHLYLDIYDAEKYVRSPYAAGGHNHYRNAGMTPSPITNGYICPHTFMVHCALFCQDPFRYPVELGWFFREVAYPMAMVSRSRKQGEDGLSWCERIAAPDWAIATTQWAERREAARQARK